MAEKSQAAAATWYLSDDGVEPVGARFDHQRPPAAIAGRYGVRDLLGKGATGTVWRCDDLIDGEEVAVKVISVLTSSELNRVRRESVAMRWARLPGVVRLRDELRLGQDWYLVMDLVA